MPAVTDLTRGLLKAIGIAATFVALTAVAVAEDAKPAGGSGTTTSAAVETKAGNVPAATPSVDNAALYCRNIANAAADARYARQVNALAALEAELDERIAALEKKRAEFEEWVSRRDEFMHKADESVVAIYSQMRPDAAAQQIAIMDPEAAAAILAKVTARTASAILNEMDAETAAYLTNVMAGLPAASKDQGKPG
jgi:flagellar motility protein MotE (MotC chaperone)